VLFGHWLAPGAPATAAFSSASIVPAETAARTAGVDFPGFVGGTGKRAGAILNWRQAREAKAVREKMEQKW